ncbi:MAG: radical SAM protein [Candidatus Omnitrophota bacterium]
MAKILFSQYFQMEQLGIMSLAAILKRSGNECRMAIGEKDVLREIASWQPDVLAATCYSGQEEWWTNLFAAAKKLNPKIITITGGPGPSFDPEIISSPQVDVVCRGEGDQSILEFIAKFNKNEDFSRTPNLWLKKNGTVVRNEVGNLLEDLDTLPFPDREIYQPYPFIYNNPTKHVLISRGCLFKCSFCYNSKWSELYENKGRYLRLRSIDNVIAELAELKEKYAFSNFLFRDSNFLIKKDWILAFLKEYQKKIGIPFYCNVIASLLDEEIVQALKESGCFLLAFGVESADEDYRMNVLNKKVTDRQIRSAAELLHRYQVPFYTTNMLGLPGEDLNSALATIRMNLEIKPAASWFAIYTPYPEEPLTEYARGKGYLKDTKLSLKDSSSYNRSLLKQKDIGQVENLQKLVYLIFAFPPFLSAAKVLIKLPYNFCFKIIHDITYLLFFVKRCRKWSFAQTVKESLVAAKYYKN